MTARRSSFGRSANPAMAAPSSARYPPAMTKQSSVNSRSANDAIGLGPNVNPIATLETRQDLRLAQETFMSCLEGVQTKPTCKFQPAFGFFSPGLMRL